MLVRGFGNPTRSMAKLMQTKVPWARDSRPSNWGENRILHAELLRSVPEKPAFGQRAVYHYRSSVDGLPIPQETRDYPVEAPIELMAAAHYEWFVYGGSCVGGGGTGSARINPNWQFVAEVTGCMLMGIQAPQSGDSLTYMIGPRWTRELRTACRPMCSSC